MNLSEYLKKIQEKFEQSDIQHKNDHWFYSICTSQPQIGQPLILGMNWGSKSDKFKPQNINDLPIKTPWDEMGELSKIRPYLNQNFPDLDINSFNQSNYCFFRSQNESFLTSKDIKLCEPIFYDFIAELKPTIIFGFSSHLRNFLISNNMIHYLNERVIPNGASSVLNYQGFLRLGGWWTHLTLLPHPSSWKYMKDQESILKSVWSFARQTYPYKIQLTEFLNYLEEQGESVSLSSNPLEENSIRTELVKLDAPKFANLNLKDFKSILPEEFQCEDIAALCRCIVKYRGDTETVRKAYKKYLAFKDQDGIQKAVEKLFDQNAYVNSLNVTRMSLQRFYMAITHLQHYKEYQVRNSNRKIFEPIIE